jgi:peroxiredoxin Q/BCP
MRLRSLRVACAALAFVVVGVGAAAHAGDDVKGAPTVGAKAPDFTLHTQSGESLALHDLQGKWVVLYFYPKDFTGGCTQEAHNFQRDLAKYEKLGAVIVGVSTQDESSHKEFCVKEGLTFKLLADTKGEVSERYASSMNMLVAQIAKRHTFLIDPTGVVKKIYLDVSPSTHSDEVLKDLAALQAPVTTSPTPPAAH